MILYNFSINLITFNKKINKLGFIEMHFMYKIRFKIIKKIDTDCRVINNKNLEVNNINTYKKCFQVFVVD